MATVPIPVRASVRDLMRDLLGAKVGVTEGVEQRLDESVPSYLATYVRDDGTPTAATISNYGAALTMGAAIAMMSSHEAAELLTEEGRIDGDVRDFFHEVVNVFAKLLNSPTTRHVKLDQVYEIPGDVPKDVAAIVLEPRTRVDYSLSVEGHDGGILTLVTQ